MMLADDRPADAIGLGCGPTTLPAETPCMTHSSAKALADELSAPNTQLGEIKRLGKAIRRDHALALDLWALGQLKARLLATLIFDRNQLAKGVKAL